VNKNSINITIGCVKFLISAITAETLVTLPSANVLNNKNIKAPVQIKNKERTDFLIFIVLFLNYS
jgi:hypothetical protein